MKLFTRQKAVPNIPPELRQYYQTQPSRGGRGPVQLIIALVVLVVSVAIFAGAAIFIVQRVTTHKPAKKPATAQHQSPVAPKNAPAKTPASGKTNTKAIPAPAQ
jgi:flagellar basal body-associated protein FliL